MSGTGRVTADLPLVWVGETIPDPADRYDPLPWDVYAVALAARPGRWARLDAPSDGIGRKTPEGRGLDVMERAGDLYLRWPNGSPPPAAVAMTAGASDVDLVAGLPLVWSDPPALGSRRPRMPWPQIADALGRRPGIWARLTGDYNAAAVRVTGAKYGLDVSSRRSSVYLRAPG